ncbi:MAG TPA: FAD-dependent oxidoreductase, partial [Vicinamibacteria bacterium]|nr:FAD-dependent oxidoreductase [Vicinamibacteria bacterium]
MTRVTIVGGGLAGCEAAWQLARRGVAVDLHEMRPVRPTPVHQTGDLAELVCSNSLRGNALDQAAGLLKEEMRRLGSLIVQVADAVKVPAGSALAVDRSLFAQKVTQAVTSLPEVTIHRDEVTTIPEAPIAIVATG